MSLLLQDYLDLATSQYQNSPKFLAWLSVPLQILQDITDCADEMYQAFDIDTAEGAQLDILGVIIGASRTVDFQPSNSVSPVLDDDTYRVLLKATIARNQWDGNIDTLAPVWREIFPGGSIVIQDSQLMSMNVSMTGSFSSIIVDLINNGYIVPRPEGVLVNYGFGDLPYFGFDRDDSYISGLDDGHIV